MIERIRQRKLLVNWEVIDMKMHVSSTKGTRICQIKDEIIEIIKQGSALPQGDEIWVSSGEKEYPCLSILIRGKYACVHYFENEEGDAWLSEGDFNEEVIFLAGDEEWTVPEYTIIPIETAINCIEEFCDTMKRPECIRWEALWEEG